MDFPSLFGHSINDRTDFIDYYTENVALTKIYACIDKHGLNSLGTVRMLISKIRPEEVITILGLVSTVQITWAGRRTLITGNDELPFVSEVLIGDSVNSLQLSIGYWSKPEHVAAVHDLLDNAFKKYKTVVGDAIIVDIDWFYNSNHGVTDRSIKEVIYETIHNEAYPYLDLDDFISGYFKSSSSVLVMSGTPGTGKTKLIRHIIRKAVADGAEFLSKFKLKHRYSILPDDDDYESNQIVRAVSKLDNAASSIRIAHTTDLEVLDKEDFYVQLRTGGYHFVVLEDIDFKLQSRTEGNELMHKFLSMSDGFITSNCKVILSTNLNVTDIDQALTRPGRCYASIETRPLTYNEAKILLAKINKQDVVLENKDHTLAEIYTAAYNLSYKDQNMQHVIGFGKKG